MIKKSILAIIPARGGSKGLKKKNIINFDGKPLINWTIEAAKRSNYLDKIIVSTDSPKIAQISQESGADIPFLRPVELSKDNSLISDAIVYTLNNINTDYDIVVLLQPTSPLRTTLDIDNSIELMYKAQTTSLVSVSKTSVNIQKVFNLKENKIIPVSSLNFDPESNRQSHDIVYTTNGAIYISYVDRYLKQKKFISSETSVYKMPRIRSIDIDSKHDLVLAEFFKNKF